VRQAASAAELRRARAFLYDPGISVLRDARIALGAGQVTAMHDPTEGGLAGALWELAEASGTSLTIDQRAVPIPALAARICRAFDLDPLAAIASGALLLTAPASDAARIRHALAAEGIICADIGEVAGGPAAVWCIGASGRERLARPLRDAIAQIYEG
jgi:hydrogenase maturation factor